MFYKRNPPNRTDPIHTNIKLDSIDESSDYDPHITKDDLKSKKLDDIFEGYTPDKSISQEHSLTNLSTCDQSNMEFSNSSRHYFTLGSRSSQIKTNESFLNNDNERDEKKLGKSLIRSQSLKEKKIEFEFTSSSETEGSKAGNTKLFRRSSWKLKKSRGREQSNVPISDTKKPLDFHKTLKGDQDDKNNVSQYIGTLNALKSEIVDSANLNIYFEFETKLLPPNKYVKKNFLKSK
ncbi:hypothetical protein GVAV_002211 [Gurleya vavrai]